jgi:hypothetical protein
VSGNLSRTRHLDVADSEGGFRGESLMEAGWLATALCWDGLLPLVAFLAPWFVKVACRKGDIAEVVVVVLVPIGLALLRMSLAQQTLRRQFGSRIRPLRQIGLGLAIVTLLFVEIAHGLLVFAPEAPIVPYAIAGWLLYFAMISAATFPPRQAHSAVTGTGPNDQ